LSNHGTHLSWYARHSQRIAEILTNRHGAIEAIVDELSNVVIKCRLGTSVAQLSGERGPKKDIVIMKITSTARAGFTLVEIMIVVAIIGLLAAIAVPNFVRARESSQLNSILNNLRLIEGAKDQWALENKKTTGSTVTSTSLATYLRNGAWVQALAGETYEIQPVGTLADATFTSLVGKTKAFADGTTQ